jgi:hypothetical protein
MRALRLFTITLTRDLEVCFAALHYAGVIELVDFLSAVEYSLRS